MHIHIDMHVGVGKWSFWETAVFRYKEVEAALAKVHDVDPENLGALKGRIIHMQRIGIGVASPGRGKKIEYTYEQVAVWAYCLQLSEYGLDPLAIHFYLDSTWARVLPILGEDADEDMIFYFLPNLMSRAFVSGRGPKAKIADGIIRASNATVAEMGKRLLAILVDTADVKRIATINLSQLRRDLIAALEETQRGSDARP